MMMTTESLMMPLYLAILFFVVSSPFMYQLTSKVTNSLSWTTADSNGCPNYAGVALHSVVFLLLAWVVLNYMA